MAVAKGLEGVVMGRSSLSLVDGLQGRLVYRGYDIRDLADHVTFEEVAYLLWHGELPNKKQLENLKATFSKHCTLPDRILKAMRTLPRSTEPMDVLRTGVSALGCGKSLTSPNLEEAVSLTAEVPTILAAFERFRKNKKPLKPRRDVDFAGNYLYLLSGKVPSEQQSRALGTYLILLADHGMNASTFAARVVASTWSDLYSSIVAAIGALKGPLHGGAPSLVLKMLQAIGKPENVEPWMRSALDRGERLMGFGHRVYKTTDPRAEILRDLASRIASPKFFELARRAEETGLRLLHERKPDQRLYTNVEFYSACVLHSVGLAADLFTPTFALSRTVGWTAHVLEQIADNRLIRPDVVYAGSPERKVPPLESR